MRPLVVRDLAPRSLQTFSDLQLWRARIIPGGAASLFSSHLSTIQEEGETLSRSESSLRSSPYSSGKSPGASFDSQGFPSREDSSGLVAGSAASDPGTVTVLTKNSVSGVGNEHSRSRDAAVPSATLLTPFRQPTPAFPGVQQTQGSPFVDRCRSRGHDGVKKGPLSPVCVHLHRRAHSSRMLLQQLDDKSGSIPGVRTLRENAARVPGAMAHRDAGNTSGTSSALPGTVRVLRFGPGGGAGHSKEMSKAAASTLTRWSPPCDFLGRPAVRLTRSTWRGVASVPVEAVNALVPRDGVSPSSGQGTASGSRRCLGYGFSPIAVLRDRRVEAWNARKLIGERKSTAVEKERRK